MGEVTYMYTGQHRIYMYMMYIHVHCIWGGGGGYQRNLNGEVVHNIRTKLFDKVSLSLQVIDPLVHDVETVGSEKERGPVSHSESQGVLEATGVG